MGGVFLSTWDPARGKSLLKLHYQTKESLNAQLVLNSTTIDIKSGSVGGAGLEGEKQTCSTYEEVS